MAENYMNEQKICVDCKYCYQHLLKSNMYFDTFQLLCQHRLSKYTNSINGNVSMLPCSEMRKLLCLKGKYFKRKLNIFQKIKKFILGDE